MNEMNAISEAYRENRRRGQRSALASIIFTSGSTYRRAGARMLIAEDGRTAGSISGGCLEADAIERARKVIATGEPLVVNYDTRAKEDILWGLGLGCQGVVELLIERLPSDATAEGPIELLSRAYSERETVLLATVVGVEGNAAGAMGVNVGERMMVTSTGVAGRVEVNTIRNVALSMLVKEDARIALAAERSERKIYGRPGEAVKVFFEVLTPPTPLVIFGAGADALPLARLAKELGWHVTVVDTRAREATRERFRDADEIVLCRAEEVGDRVKIGPRTAAVLMSHNYLDDLDLLEELHRSEAPYIGILGPRKRTERLLGELLTRDRSSIRIDDARLHSPIGLDIGADTPEEIALSIVAEIRAVFAGREGRFLRERRSPIHHDSAPESPAVGALLQLQTTDLIPAAAKRVSVAG